ncbi:hypothetical protein RR46_05126 [Papilio xuthus]|uniref:Uncharacterized protein n=1 Tax=Papilio xuthus TaxID=66420 RepID=A0A194Q8Q2_PAPXU|nr:hypothetical protein RR46_05126 [Papilio xuthus]
MGRGLRLAPEVLSHSPQYYVWRQGAGRGERAERGAASARPSARAATASSVRVGELPATLVCELDPSDTLLVYGVP